VPDLRAGSEHAARITVASARVQLGWEAVESPVKSAASDGVLAIDADTVAVLKAWRRTQLAERLSMGEHWTDTGLVFTLEDGTAYHPDRLTDIFEWEAFRAGMPPIRLHDLRHSAASIARDGREHEGYSGIAAALVADDHR
jgi:integrase